MRRFGKAVMVTQEDSAAPLQAAMDRVFDPESRMLAIAHLHKKLDGLKGWDRIYWCSSVLTRISSTDESATDAFLCFHLTDVQQAVVIATVLFQAVTEFAIEEPLEKVFGVSYTPDAE